MSAERSESDNPARHRARLADHLVRQLCDGGIRNFFTLTGRGSLFLTDAIAREPRAAGVFALHEQTLGFAASAASSFAGDLAVVLVSSGCAATNLATAVLGAWQDEHAVLIISGQNYRNSTQTYSKSPVRTYGEQEANVLDALRPFCKKSIFVANPDDFPSLLADAVRTAKTAPFGPVHIDIPLDMQSALLEGSLTVAPDVPEEVVRTSRDHVKPWGLASDPEPVSRLLNASQRPLVILGGQSLTSAEISRVVLGARQLSIPVVHETSILPRVGFAHLDSLGCLSALGGDPVGHLLLRNADLIIAVGTHLRSSTIGSPEAIPLNASILTTSREVEMRFVDRKATLLSVESLVDQINALEFTRADLTGWNSFALAARHLCNEASEARFSSDCPRGEELHHLARILNSSSEQFGAVALDSGQTDVIIPPSFDPDRGIPLIHAFSQGSMGACLGYLLGLATVAERPLLGIVGDGSFLMNVQELVALKDLGKSVTIMVPENNLYGIIRHRQKSLFRGRTIGTGHGDGLPQVQIRSIAEGFGAAVRTAIGPDDIKHELDSPQPGLNVVLCPIGEDQAYQACTRVRRGLQNPLKDGLSSPIFESCSDGFEDLIKNLGRLV